MKLFSILFSITFVFAATAQTEDTIIQNKNTLDVLNVDDYNRWSVGFSFGGHDGMVPVKTNSNIAFQLAHFGGEGRYMFNNRFGVKLDFGYDLMNFDDVGRSNYWRTSVQGVINLRDVLRFDTWTDRFGLLVHGGAGVSHLWLAKSLQSEDMNTTFLDGLDDMINYTFGITPQVKITERFSVKSDLTFTCHTRQSTYWDRLSTEGHELDHGQINGYFFNFSIGASFYFGKNKRHADWTPTEYGVLPDNSAMTDRITQLELELKDKLQDDDGDGVVNGRDEEPNSVPGSVVNSKGIALLDSDGDGVKDFRDEEPNTIPGSVVNSKGVALVDTDKDGIEDRFDACPEVAGLFSENGCPEVVEEVNEDVQEIMNYALKGVKFETARSVLLIRSYVFLDNIITVLNDHPSYYLQIDGHTDNIGSDVSNLALSKARARACVDYFVSKGIARYRLHSEGYGASTPSFSNETAAGRSENRRVEFKVVFE